MITKSTLKISFSLFAILIISNMSFAQEQNPECTNNLSIFVENVKTKNFALAYEPWKMVYDSCPKLNYATYSYAKYVVGYKIKNSTGDEQMKYIDNIMKVYSDGHTYFPRRMSYADMKINQAFIYYDNKLKTNEELFAILDEAFKKDRTNFDNSRALLGYFYSAVDTYGEGKKSLQEVFDVYDNVTEKINEVLNRVGKVNDQLLQKEEAGTLTAKDKKRMKNNEKIERNLSKVSSSLESKLGGLANCDKLLPLYKKNIESHKANAVWLRRAANRMEEKECTNDPIFIDIVESLHKVDASANSAYYLGILNDKAGKNSEAIKYYNEAISLETDSSKKGKTALKISAKLKKIGQRRIAYGYAKKALSYSPSLGEAYLIMATIYGDSANECGSTTFEKRAVYWKAANVAKKAAAVKPSIKGKARKIVVSYEKRAPSKADIFESGMAGKTITLKCWIGGNISVPKL